MNTTRLADTYLQRKGYALRPNVTPYYVTGINRMHSKPVTVLPQLCKPESPVRVGVTSIECKTCTGK
jgi:hypothetical protein